jgi:hypothetical protein
MVRKMSAHQTIDETLSFTKCAQWLIETLTHFNIDFKIYNLGCGVKRITTVTDVCPCCKKTLKG